MKTIWRFNFEVTDQVTVKMPLPARVLPRVEANGPYGLSVWAEVTPGSESVDKRLAVVGTGNPMPLDLGAYVGTVSVPPFVWHVYEVAT